MTQEVAERPARQPAGIMAKLAQQYDMDPRALHRTLAATVFPSSGKEVTPEQMAAFAIVAWEYKLNPLTKQIYAFPEGRGGIIPIISVDGWYALANRQAAFDGIEFEYLEEDGKVAACTATVWRKDRSHPVRLTEYVAECKRNTPPWNNQPRRMIRHRAAIQAFRVAFGISALDPEEAARVPEYDMEAGGEEAQVHAPTLEGARARLDDAEAEERSRGSEAPAAPEPQRKRRSRAVKAQREELEEHLASGQVDPALLSPDLPDEGETVEDAFASMWSDEAELLLERARAGTYQSGGDGGPELQGEPPGDDAFTV